MRWICTNAVSEMFIVFYACLFCLVDRFRENFFWIWPRWSLLWPVSWQPFYHSAIVEWYVRNNGTTVLAPNDYKYHRLAGKPLNRLCKNWDTFFLCDDTRCFQYITIKPQNLQMHYCISVCLYFRDAPFSVCYIVKFVYQCYTFQNDGSLKQICDNFAYQFC